ncbi:MAG TPA: hypothetical protein VF676_07525 [Flavobacterium sp.]|jgi:hypothetical protein
MYNKQAFYNFTLAFSLLFAILFQSAHSIEHLVEQLTTEHCHHELVGKVQVTHDHQHLDHCPICDFTFSSFIAAPEYIADFFPGHSFVRYMVRSVDAPFIAPSEALTLRGPPSFIV